MPKLAFGATHGSENLTKACYPLPVGLLMQTVSARPIAARGHRSQGFTGRCYR